MPSAHGGQTTFSRAIGIRGRPTHSPCPGLISKIWRLIIVAGSTILSMNRWKPSMPALVAKPYIRRAGY